MSIGKRFDAGWLTIFIVLVFGAVAAVISVQQGWISAEVISKYGLWGFLGLVVLFLFATHVTRSKWDDIILTYLLVLAIGGVASTYLIDHGFVTQGYVLLGGMILLFLLLLVLYSKVGYSKVARRFQ